MLGLTLQPKERYSVICLGAHCDDIEIGCGGTLRQLIRKFGDRLDVRWVIFSATDEREHEARKAAEKLLRGSGSYAVSVHRFRDGFFPAVWGDIKERFEALKEGPAPDIVFSHCRHDQHQDHRTVCDLTWNTFRDHLVLEYEIPKYDGDLSRPNLFVPLDPEVCREKVDVIMGCYASQHSKHWLTSDTLMGLMRLRGVECASPSGMAEAFYGRKLIL